MRKITILQKSDTDKWYACNLVQIEQDGKVWTAHWSNDQLKIEQMRDRLIAAGADETLVDEFRDAVREEAYNDGCRDTSESESI